MTGLVIASLGVALVGAVAVVVAGDRRRMVTTVAAGLAAGGWVVVAAAGTPPTLGRMTFDPVLAAALAGTSLLVAARPPGATLSCGVALCSVPVLAAAAGSGGEGIPDRPLAVAVVAVAALALVVHRVEWSGRVLDLAPLLVGAAVTAAGAVVSAANQAAPAVLAGAGIVLVGALRRDAPGRLALPAVMLAVARIVPAALADGIAPGRVATVGAVAAAAVAVGVAVVARRGPVGTDRLGIAAVAGGVALLACDLPGAAGAGLLAAAAGILVLAAGDGVALVALVPALASAPVVMAQAVEPAQGATAAALVGLLVAASIRPLRPPARPAPGGRLVAAGRRRPTGWALVTTRWPLAVAVTFGLAPAWGWTGASPDDVVPAAATAAAFALVAGVTMTMFLARSAGTLVVRRAPTASSDGRTQHDLPQDGAEGFAPSEEPEAP